MISPNDELRRYVEYLQHRLMTAGAEGVHDAGSVAEWISGGEPRLREMAARLGLDDAAVADVLADASTYSPSTRFNDFWSARIFGPLLGEVLKGARTIGLAPSRPVVLATSTDLSAGPVSRPSSGEHILFAGAGTSSFCNYWAKAFAWLVVAHAKSSGTGFATPDTVEATFAANPGPLLLAAKLALHYRFLGSSVGFGIVPDGPEAVAYRIALCHAMELHAIAHEVGHFHYEETNPTHSTDPRDLDLELHCDFYALTVCRTIGAPDDWISYSGTGGVALLHACRLSGINGGWLESQSDSHPQTELRLAHIRNKAVEFAHSDDRGAVAAYLRDFDMYAAALSRAVDDVVESAAVPSDAKPRQDA